MTSEDYLESLLKQAEETDDPNSARSRIREINRREAEEKAAEEPVTAEPSEDAQSAASKESTQPSIGEMLELAENSDYSNDADLKNLLESIDKELEATDSEAASSLLDVEKLSEEMHETVEKDTSLQDTDDLLKMLDNLELNEAISNAKENIGDSFEDSFEDSVESSIESSIERSIESSIEGNTENSEITDTDVNIDDYLKLSEIAETTENTDNPATDEISDIENFTEDSVKIEDSDILGEVLEKEETAPLEEPSLEESSLEEPSLEEPSLENPADEIEKLLQTDFSGEVEVEDIDKLLAAAEDFAKTSGEEENSAQEPDAEIDSETQNLLNSENEKQENTDADDALALDQDEIEKLLSKAEEQPVNEANEAGEVEIDLNNLDNLESLGIFDKNDVGEGVGDDAGEGLDEITMLLNTASSNEPASDEDLEMLNLLENTISEQKAAEEKEKNQIDNLFENDIEVTDNEETKKEKKAKKEKKKKKKSDSDEGQSSDSAKKNPFKKLFEFMTAEEEEDNDALDLQGDWNAEEQKTPNTNEEGANGENKEILDEVDNQDAAKGKGKKKKKKGKKGEDKASAEESDGEESAAEPKKPKKEKKERKPLVLDIDTGKPLSKKNVKLIFLLAASLLVCIIVAASIIPKVITNAYARKAYYSGDYETVYTTFFGQKMNESDQLLYGRSEIILKVQHKYMAYSAYSKMDMKTEALDQLLQAVDKYETWLFVAESLGCTEAFKAEYGKILVALNEDFGIDETAARAVLALPTDLEYSLMCEAIANKTEYIDPNAPLPGPFVAPTQEPKVEYQDVLPEEEQ